MIRWNSDLIFDLSSKFHTIYLKIIENYFYLPHIFPGTPISTPTPIFSCIRDFLNIIIAYETLLLRNSKIFYYKIDSYKN